MVCEVACVKRNPLPDLDKILQGGRYSGRNHLCKSWWRSVKGFTGGGGSNFALLHWLWSSIVALTSYNILTLLCKCV